MERSLIRKALYSFMNQRICSRKVYIFFNLLFARNELLIWRKLNFVPFSQLMRFNQWDIHNAYFIFAKQRYFCKNLY